VRELLQGTDRMGMARTTEIGHSWEVDEIDRQLRARLSAAYDEDGVDRSLIRACLDRTPDERLADLEASVEFLQSARRLGEERATEEADGSVSSTATNAG
jgi:glycyl-tRNA synthetase beta subunit